MAPSIFGEWTSQNGSGDMYRYTFNEDGTYVYSTRLKGYDSWTQYLKGRFRYEDRLLSLEYAPQIWHTIGYVGIENDEMIEGFKLIAGSGGIESTWQLDVTGSIGFKLRPLSLDMRITVTFENGVMTGTCTLWMGKQLLTIENFSGKYALDGETITICDTENVHTGYLTEGKKKICIIDNVLDLLDDVTANSDFRRTVG